MKRQQSDVLPWYTCSRRTGSSMRGCANRAIRKCTLGSGLTRRMHKCAVVASCKPTLLLASHDWMVALGSKKATTLVSEKHRSCEQVRLQGTLVRVARLNTHLRMDDGHFQHICAVHGPRNALEAILAEVRHSARSRLDPRDDKRVLWYVFVSCCEVRLRAEICSHCLNQPYLDHDNHGNLTRCFLAFPHT